MWSLIVQYKLIHHRHNHLKYFHNLNQLNIKIPENTGKGIFSKHKLKNCNRVNGVWISNSVHFNAQLQNFQIMINHYIISKASSSWKCLHQVNSRKNSFNLLETSITH